MSGRLHWQAIAYLLLSFGKDSTRLFFYRRSRTFFTAVGRFLPRGVFWSHAPHDCGCGGGDTKENLFSDCRRRHSHKGEAFRRRYGFLYLSHPYGGPPHPHFVCCHRKQIIFYMFFGHQTIISLRFVISYCIYGRKGTHNYRHSQSKWQEKSGAGGCSMYNQRDIDTKRFAAFQGCALCVCGCRQCRREHALGHLPPSPSAPACRQAEKPQMQKVRLWR